MSHLYLYGVIGAGQVPEFESEGLAGGLRVIRQGDVGVIAGSVPAGGMHGLARDHVVASHQRVLEEAMAQTAVLPVQAGTVAPDEYAVNRMLTQGGTLLGSRLAEFRDRMQVEVVAQWRIDQIAAEMAAEADVAGLRQAAAGSVHIAQAAKGVLTRRRAALSAELCAELQTVAAEVRERPSPGDDDVAASFALLIDRMDAPSLQGLLNRLYGKMEGQIDFRSSGPLPPSSFATVEVTFPEDGAIARACKMLELGEQASCREIRTAYRRIACSRFASVLSGDMPDHAGGMAALTAAYHTLMSYAESEPSAGTDADRIFNAAAAASRVTVNVVRKTLGRPALILAKQQDVA
jgi:hypothetical protein